MFRLSALDANEYRRFCSNELSAMIDNDGGICFLNLIDCHYLEGYRISRRKFIADLLS